MDVLECIQTRRSVREFSDEDIPKEDILKIINAARMAPSGHNVQPWHFLVVKKKETLEEMAKVVEDSIEKIRAETKDEDLKRRLEFLKPFSIFFKNAPVVVVVLTDCFSYRDRILQHYMNSGFSEFEANKKRGFPYIQSVGAAIQNLLLAAHALGYGACWMTMPLIAREELERILRIKADWDIIALIPIGKPVKVPKMPIKKSLEEIVTFLE
jgi:nitroreductase